MSEIELTFRQVLTKHTKSNYYSNEQE